MTDYEAGAAMLFGLGLGQKPTANMVEIYHECMSSDPTMRQLGMHRLWAMQTGGKSSKSAQKTLLDEFAMAALTGFCTHWTGTHYPEVQKQMAMQSYAIAKAMMTERERQT